jgi:hypothetical protein
MSRLLRRYRYAGRRRGFEWERLPRAVDPWAPHPLFDPLAPIGGHL